MDHITSGDKNIWPCVAGGVVAGAACALAAVHAVPMPAMCKPSRPQGKIVLHYFPIPAMGEPVRLLLELGGFDWEDKVVDFKTWGEGTLKKQAQWGQMPFMLLEDGTQFTQSRAMVKFLANYVTVSGTPLMPSDPMVVYQVDMLMDAFEDMLNKLRKTFATADAAEKAAEREKLFLPGGECAELFKKMDAVCGADYLVAGQLTYGDLYFYVLVAFLRCGFWQDPAPGVPANFIEAYPKLKGVCDRFGAIPEVKAYYATKSGNKMYAVMQ